MRVRTAEPSDAEAIAELYRELVPGDAAIRVAAERIAQLLTDRSNFLFVVEAAGAVRGTAFLTICLDAMYGLQPYGVVENVVVAEAYRHKGFGHRLFAEIEAIAKRHGCTKLMLLSNESRASAHRFFASLGFDGLKKRGFVKYLNRGETRAPRT
jgi:N-acetylglutamate synthase-like GNAT family acetyltransferase